MKVDFKQKVQSMSADEIIMAMVESLRNPYTEIDMGNWGSALNYDSGPVCYGCAATNTIIHLIGGSKDHLISGNRHRGVDDDYHFVSAFEDAIDDLRRGSIYGYNIIASRNRFAVIDDNLVYEFDENIPMLTNSYTQKELDVYVELANRQKQLNS